MMIIDSLYKDLETEVLFSHMYFTNADCFIPLNKKFRFKRASPSFISNLGGREMQIKTLLSRDKLLTQASSEKYASKFYNITTAI